MSKSYKPIEAFDKVPSRALWFLGPGQVEIRDEEALEQKKLGAREVRIRTIYSGISAGTEMLLYRGLVPSNLAVGIDAPRKNFEYPMKYGYCNVGRVLEVGTDCEKVRQGDAVFTLHPHETEFMIQESSCRVLSESVDAKRGVFLANLETAIGAVHDSEVKLGESAVVFGLGTVGILTALLLKRCGAASVIGVDLYERRRSIAKTLGIERVFSPDELSSSSTMNLGLNGLGPDVLIELSGSPVALQQAIDLGGFESRIIVGSWYGKKEVCLDLGSRFHRNRNIIIGTQVSNINSKLSSRWTKDRRIDLAQCLLEELEVENLITDEFPFDNAAVAYKKIEEHPESTLQVILDYSR